MIGCKSTSKEQHMDSTYKTQPVRKLDGLTVLERSGYGIPRVKEAPIRLGEYIKEGGRAILAVLAVLTWAVFLIII